MNDNLHRPMPSVALLGATSSIARAMAFGFARRGYAVGMAGRNAEELETLAADLRVRFDVPCHALQFDALDTESHAAFVDECRDAFGAVPDGVVVCFGELPDQAAAQTDPETALRCLAVNYTGAMSVLERFAEEMERRRWGFLAAVSSVAGDRGRKSCYHYGAAKAALSAYLEGLRHRMHGARVRVTTLKPGYTDTRMTYGLPLPRPLVTSPEKAGELCVRALLKGRAAAYIPGYWRLIMAVIRHIPGAVFNRTNL